MATMTICDKIMELSIALRKCDTANAFNLKIKILYLLRHKQLTPSEIMVSLMLNKCNLALIANNMVKEGLIRKENRQSNKREIEYYITESGKDLLTSKLNSIEYSAKKSFPAKEEYQDASAAFDSAINALEFFN